MARAETLQGKERRRRRAGDRALILRPLASCSPGAPGGVGEDRLAGRRLSLLPQLSGDLSGWRDRGRRDSQSEATAREKRLLNAILRGHRSPATCPATPLPRSAALRRRSGGQVSGGRRGRHGVRCTSAFPLALGIGVLIVGPSSS